MKKVLQFLGFSVASVGMCAGFGDAYADSGRSSLPMNNGRAAVAMGTQRMPTMSTLNTGIIGNASSSNVSGGTTPVIPTPTPTPTTCPDGGEVNTTLTVDSCMNSIAQCVNNGGLVNGINSLFNEDLRNSIINGMSLCASQVDACVGKVRVNCVDVFPSRISVWTAFNARKVQPEYYNFVLRQTGLTPNQAENTCLLLDRNTYGSSFTAVGTGDNVTSEYARGVGAYNSQNGGSLSKNNPQGTAINTDGTVDGKRGYYARWDAEQGQCLIRVAAYYDDELVTNEWLGIGDKTPAEAWKKAGETFTCNKDLFGFSLMNKTKSVALIGVTTGAGIGAAVGAGVAAAKIKNSTFSCSDQKDREKLMDVLRENRLITELAAFYGQSWDYSNGSIQSGNLNNDINFANYDVTAKEIKEADCKKILNLYQRYNQVSSAVSQCEASNTDCNCGTERIESQSEVENSTLTISIGEVGGNNVTLSRQEVQEIIDFLQDPTKLDTDEIEIQGIKYKKSDLQSQQTIFETHISENRGDEVCIDGRCKEHAKKCCFVSLQLNQSDIYCDEMDSRCTGPKTMRKQLNVLSKVFNSIEDTISAGTGDNKINKAKEYGKDIAIGTVVGASAGGLATAITAFVERDKLHCVVGDGLAQVSYKKPYTIENLRDFYVKWNLNLPDTQLPTASVTTCAEWRTACSYYTDLNDCNNVTINYKPSGSNATTVFSGACQANGTVCEISSVALGQYCSGSNQPGNLGGLGAVTPGMVTPATSGMVNPSGAI